MPCKHGKKVDIHQLNARTITPRITTKSGKLRLPTSSRGVSTPYLSLPPSLCRHNQFRSSVIIITATVLLFPSMHHTLPLTQRRDLIREPHGAVLPIPALLDLNLLLPRRRRHARIPRTHRQSLRRARPLRRREAPRRSASAGALWRSKSLGRKILPQARITCFMHRQVRAAHEHRVTVTGLVP